MSGIEFLPLVAIAVLFWLVIIRPQSRRAKELRSLQSSLGIGDEVMLTSGIFGVVRRLDDEHAYVEIAPQAEVKVLRAAVGTTVTYPLDEPDADSAGSGAPASDETN